MNNVFNAIAVAWRELLRRPVVSLAAWLALALGIALNTAMFSVVSGFLLRPLPVEDIDSVVRVREVARGDGAEQVLSMSPVAFDAWRENNSVFSGMAAATGRAVTLGGSGDAVRLSAAVVTANFFDVLGIAPLHGREFVSGEDQSGTNDVAILSHRVWQARFGGRENAIGRTLVIDDRPVTVVGIMPPGLHHPYEAEIWLPLAFDTLLRSPRGNFLYVPARLRPGIELPAARAELDRMAQVLHAARPELGESNASHLVFLRDELLGTLRPVIFVLLAGSLLVLVLAMLNVINLLLSRTVSERHENAVRVALGARGRDLFLRAFLRHILLTAGAWLAGLALCTVLLEPLLGLSAAASIDEFDAAARLDTVTAAYSFALAVFIALLLALIESFRATVAAPADALGQSRDGSVSSGLRRRLAVLVVLQFAVSFTLAGSAVLVASGYERLVHGDRGYDVADLTLFDLAFAGNRYPDVAQREVFVSQLLDRVRTLPGVSMVGAATVTPDYGGAWGGQFRVPGHESSNPTGYELTNHRLASPGYLGTLGIPLLAGRDFDARNPERDTGAVMISREFAERYWGGVQEAVGRTFMRHVRGENVALTVVGVVGDVREAEQAQNWTVTRAWYLPLSMGTDYDFGGITIAVRGGGVQLLRLLRDTVRELDPGLAPFAMMAMTERLAETYSRERFSRFLFALFGVTACVIAVIGLFSALHFVTALRRREFGVRIALGASPVRVATTVLRDSVVVGIAGLLAGLPLLAALIVLLESYFEGVRVEEAGMLIVPAAVLCIAAVFSALLPALRAARIEPMQVLREE